MYGSSYKYFKSNLREYLISKYDKGSTVLDVGAGGGTYALLLGDYFELDAVEVYKPTAEFIEDRYKRVFNEDIRNFKYKRYDIIIFGDVLEHLDVEDAQKVLAYAIPRCSELIVAVPYQYKQGIVDGNIYEIHKQDDLTPQIMFERYPYLRLLFRNDEYGYYCYP